MTRATTSRPWSSVPSQFHSSSALQGWKPCSTAAWQSFSVSAQVGFTGKAIGGFLFWVLYEKRIGGHSTHPPPLAIISLTAGSRYSASVSKMPPKVVSGYDWKIGQ